MNFPLGDWQFWVASALACAAMLWLLRGLIPWRRLLGRPPRRRGRRATLTLDGVPVDRDRCH